MLQVGLEKDPHIGVAVQYEVGDPVLLLNVTVEACPGEAAPREGASCTVSSLRRLCLQPVALVPPVALR